MPDHVRFTETMAGRLGPGEDPRLGEAAATETSFFTLTVITTDVDAMVVDPRHRSPAFGCAVFPALHPLPMSVHQGHLDLFVDAEPNRLEMRYHLDLFDTDGGTWELTGVKLVARRRWFPTVLTDTTTLFVRIKEVNGQRRFAGVLYMNPGGVTAQGLTFRGGGRFFGIPAIFRFMRYYIGRVFVLYTGPRSP